MIDPELTAVLDLLPAIDLSDPVAAREAFEAVLEALRGEVAGIEALEIEDRFVPGWKGDPDVGVRVYRPRDRPGPVPGVLLIHGGGFIIGSVEAEHAGAAMAALQTGAVVVSVEYRLAPEHPWPAAPDDAEAAARWIAENPKSFGRTFTSMILCGDSAGGNLTVVSALALRDRPAALPVILQFAIYPAIEPGASYPSKSEFSDGYGLELANMRLYEEHYRSDKAHWRASPLRADQAGLPPTLVVTAALDPLRDEGRAYAAATILAGVPTFYREIPGTIHGFASYRSAIPSAQRDLTAILDLAREVIRLSPGFTAR